MAMFWQPEEAPEAVEHIFGDALTAPKAWLISRTRGRRTEYYQSLSTNWSKTKWTTSRETACGFATEGEAIDFKRQFRVRGQVVQNEAR